MICSSGPHLRVCQDPVLRQDSIALFHETMFCPTVIGSPMGNACRIVRKYEEHSRSYYSSAIVREFGERCPGRVGCSRMRLGRLQG